MKQKLLLIALLVIGANAAFAGSTLSHENWRWRNDNGNETTATFKAAQNTAFTLADKGIIRLRIRVENTSASENQHGVFKVSYSTTPSVQNSFVDITETAGTNAFVYATSTFVASGAPTTNSTYLTTVNKNSLSPYNYANGVFISTNQLGGNNVLASTYRDFEFVIKATANVAVNTTYYFKADNSDTRTGSDPTQTLLPHLTTAAVLPVSFISFDLSNEGNGVKFNWSTASEQDNDHFDVLRSTDGTNWTTVTSVAGNGNSSAKNVYTAKDNNPVNGINYYRLIQYDKNGASTVPFGRCFFSGNSIASIFQYQYLYSTLKTDR